jgi:hypothetical protein
MLTQDMKIVGQYLVDADAVARLQGAEYGLCDSVDNRGRPYQSAGLASWLELLKAEGVKPILKASDVKG